MEEEREREREWGWERRGRVGVERGGEGRWFWVGGEGSS